jgi:hypothetical protein
MDGAHDVQFWVVGPLQVTQLVLHGVHDTTGVVVPELVIAFAKVPVGHAVRQEVPFRKEPTGQVMQVLMVP